MGSFRHIYGRGLGLLVALSATWVDVNAEGATLHQSVAAEDDGPTIQLSAAKERIHHEKPAHCEVWVDPARGFIDSCDPPQATAEGSNTVLEVITLDKGDWLEALPEDEAEASPNTTAEAPPQTPLEVLPQVLTSWAEPILDIVTLNLDAVPETPDPQSTAGHSANPVASVIRPLVQAVATVSQVVLPQPTQQAPAEAPANLPTSSEQVVSSNPMVQPTQPLEPIALALPVQTSPPVAMVAVEASQHADPPQSVTPSRAVQPAPTEKVEHTAVSQSKAGTSSEKPVQKSSWRYRNQPKETYEWPKNPVSRVLKGIVSLIHWVFN